MLASTERKRTHTFVNITHAEGDISIKIPKDGDATFTVMREIFAATHSVSEHDPQLLTLGSNGSTMLFHPPTDGVPPLALAKETDGDRSYIIMDVSDHLDKFENIPVQRNWRFKEAMTGDFIVLVEFQEELGLDYYVEFVTGEKGLLPNTGSEFVTGEDNAGSCEPGNAGCVPINEGAW